jgi:ferredoxin-NADP reductase
LNGRRYERTYSLTQLDHATCLAYCKKVEKGVVSQWLIDHIQTVTSLILVNLMAICAAPETVHPLILLAAGSGITPMYSLIQALLSKHQMDQQPVHLLYWVKKQSDVVFQQYFEQLSQQYPQFKFDVFYTQEEAPADTRLIQSIST